MINDNNNSNHHLKLKFYRLSGNAVPVTFASATSVAENCDELPQNCHEMRYDRYFDIEVLESAFEPAFEREDFEHSEDGFLEHNSETEYLEKKSVELTKLEITPLVKCESYIDSSSCSESIKANESVYCYESLIDDVSSKDDTKNRQEFDVNYKLLYENEKQISNLQNAEIKNMKRLLRNAQRVNQRCAKTIYQKEKY